MSYPEIAAHAIARTWIEKDEANVHFFRSMAARIDSYCSPLIYLCANSAFSGRGGNPLALLVHRVLGLERS